LWEDGGWWGGLDFLGLGVFRILFVWLGGEWFVFEGLGECWELVFWWSAFIEDFGV